MIVHRDFRQPVWEHPRVRSLARRLERAWNRFFKRS
jgi:hypothetical protein